MITQLDLNELMKPHSKMAMKELWQKAFDEYNTDLKPKYPLMLGCGSCYGKVFMYLKKKIELNGA